MHCLNLIWGECWDTLLTLHHKTRVKLGDINEKGDRVKQIDVTCLAVALKANTLPALKANTLPQRRTCYRKLRNSLSQSIWVLMLEKQKIANFIAWIWIKAFTAWKAIVITAVVQTLEHSLSTKSIIYRASWLVWSKPLRLPCPWAGLAPDKKGGGEKGTSTAVIWHSQRPS